MNIRIEPRSVRAGSASISGGPERVAVVMAAHNAERTIVQAVNSLLGGTFPCKVYVVDDASRIPVKQIPALSGRAGIEIIRLDRNVGPAAARNVALARILASGHEYVAVMDADDISHPARLEKQIAFLDANPSIALVGCWERIIEEYSGSVMSYFSLPCEHDEIRDHLYSKMGVPHPTWLMRARILSEVGHYSTTYRAAEDYELLRRIVARFKVANIPEFLLDYRLSSGGVSLSHRNRQLLDRLRIQLRYFAPLNWRAWAGVARTLALLALRTKRKVPGVVATPAAKVLQRA